MYIEYCNYNKTIRDISAEDKKIFEALDQGILNFAMPIHFIKRIRPLLTNDCILSVPIDYPLGHSDLKMKQSACIHAFKMGANAIDYVLNFSKTAEDISNAFDELFAISHICKDFSASLRVFVDFEHRTTKETIDLAAVLVMAGVDLVFPTLGYHNDEFLDNLIMTKNIEDKAGMSCIFNGHIWKKEQLDLTIDAKIFGIRLYRLDLWCNNI